MTSTIKFSGYVKLVEGKTLFDVKGELTKKNNNIVKGFYEMKSKKKLLYTYIPYNITGHIDNNGYLFIQTWHTSFLRGQLCRNNNKLLGINDSGKNIEWNIVFEKT